MLHSEKKTHHTRQQLFSIITYLNSRFSDGKILRNNANRQCKGEKYIKYPITRKEHRVKLKSCKKCFVILKSPSLFFQLSGREEEGKKFCNIKKGIIFNGDVIASDVDKFKLY